MLLFLLKTELKNLEKKLIFKMRIVYFIYIFIFLIKNYILYIYLLFIIIIISKYIKKIFIKFKNRN